MKNREVGPPVNYENFDTEMLEEQNQIESSAEKNKDNKINSFNNMLNMSSKDDTPLILG